MKENQMKENQMPDNSKFVFFKKRFLIVVICFFMISIVSGCSAVSSLKKQTKKVTGILRADSHLIKKAAVLISTETGSFSGQPFQKLFQMNLFDSIKDQCPDILLMFPGDDFYPKQLLDLSIQTSDQTSDQIDNFALAKIGRNLGLNAIILVKPLEIEAKEKEKGFWLLKDTHYFGIVQTEIEVYNTATGAKLLHESLDREAEISGTDFDSVKSGKIADIYELDEAAEEVAGQAGNLICEIIGKQAWQGYIISVKNNKITLSSGRESGLEPGEILDVFENRESIISKYGKFLVPGQKIGEIKITAVFLGKSEAVTLEGTEIKEGCLVRPK
ncbi:hypothetical protein QUF70_01175 [Desulfobacterales bacterium HSG17]|nr:hypothetical protein [Desulfobacterales bacterium HSG17]